jgi:diacylglycerol kinase (ATP)
MSAPYQRVHVIINPASGPNRPILNTLNDVFRRYGVEWDVSITRRYGDATRQAQEAIARGVDLVAGYGGDGTQHELANAVIGTDTPMGILPGGTGNGFAREIGIPKDLAPAVELLCTSRNICHIDAGRVPLAVDAASSQGAPDGAPTGAPSGASEYFIQRLYAGIPPEAQTSRDLKERFGLLAYAITLPRQVLKATESQYRLTVDDEVIEVSGIKCYIVNSGRTGTGLTVDVGFSPTDGLLDVFVISRKPLSLMSAEARFLNLPTMDARLYYWRGRQITIEADPEQAIWMDGEYHGASPVTATVVPGALHVVGPLA